ncbi:class I SAM-dependent methyltransferase [Chitinophaga sancti]|uniref:class I SAM-dependent methyltransferase n=1 Tax=Chitinophaga sancti TaxID=1004 RepID=UPI002A74AC2F|nr:class I SAM-dependent methyltransferase [Chitinophaga sancti]WPQ65956.1 class I SAM-dependent methyltransferase [Chitinophaga sancti]
MRLIIKKILKRTALPLYLKFRGICYRGTNVTCPCCNHSFTRFLPLGVDRRPGQCPRCRSNERDRALWLYLHRHPGFIAPGKKLLHVGPETIFYNYFTKIKGLQYTPADKFARMFESTYPADTIYLDITNMPEIPDNTYDVILCSHVLEYIHDDERAMRELRRVLKPNGTALIQVPVRHGMKSTYQDDSITSPAQRAIAFGDPGHIRFYGEDYADKLALQGFKPDFIPFTTLFTAEEIRRYGLVKNDEFQLTCKGELYQQLAGVPLLLLSMLA